MLALGARRSTLLLLAAGGLGACAGAPELPRSLTLVPGERTTLTLRTYRGPQLSLHNESSGRAADVYSTTTDPLRKVVPDAELQTLLDVFTKEGLFATSLPRPPAGARDVLVLEQQGQTWQWARRGQPADPREAAFRIGQSYFLALYNGNTAYHSSAAPSGDRPDFDDAARRAREEAEAARRRLQQLPDGSRDGQSRGGQRRDGQRRGGQQ